MGFIDLHVHSNASDGTLSPRKVVQLAYGRKLDAIALTDHDTVAGVEEALVAAQELSSAPGSHKLEVIPGIELSCVYQGTEIHILGMFVDDKNESFTGALTQLREIREERNNEMIRRFCEDGMGITREELMAGNPHTVITRAHFARVLVAKNYAGTMDQAFKKYLQYGGRYCLRKEKISPERAMEILALGHAFPVLAHPMQYKLGYKEIETLVQLLIPLGLGGIEAYHSSNNQYESGKLKDMANAYHLVTSGGSDFHGSNKPDIDIGTGRGGLRLSHLLLNDMKEAYEHGRNL